MPDSGFIIPPTVRVINASSVALEDGSIEFYDAGTLTPRVVYSNSGLTAALGSTVYLDSGGHPVATLGSSTKVIVYTSASLVKMVVKDSLGTTVATYDNVKVTEDTSGLGGGGASTEAVAGVLSKTADYTVLTTDEGKWINADPTGATFTLTLPNAVTAGDGWAFGVRHAGGLTTTNAVRVATVGGQSISGDGSTGLSSIAMTGSGEAVWFACDGSGWSMISHTPPHIVSGSTVTIQVEDRLSGPPASPSIGSLYIIQGAPAGAWVGYAEHDIVQIVGTSLYRKWTPPANCGWMAYVKEEAVLTQFRASAWVDLSNITAPTTSTMSRAVFQDQKANGTAGGTPTSGAWTTRTLNTTVTNTIAGCSLASDVVTLPAGAFLVIATAPFYRTDTASIRFKSTTTSTAITGGQVFYADANSDAGPAFLCDVLTLSAEEDFKLEYFVNSNNGGTQGLGIATTINTAVEIYSSLTIIDLTSIQGPTGARGEQGAIYATPSGALTLANGANANVVIGTNQKLRITGPTGSFSINGFVAPSYDGYVLFLYNPTAQTMTLTNDATSTAANRILTMTGADVALTGPSMATLIYDTTDARWILQSTQG